MWLTAEAGESSLLSPLPDRLSLSLLCTDNVLLKSVVIHDQIVKQRICHVSCSENFHLKNPARVSSLSERKPVQVTLGFVS